MICHSFNNSDTQKKDAYDKELAEIAKKITTHMTKLLKYIFKYSFMYIENQLCDCMYGWFTHQNTFEIWDKQRNWDTVN